MPRLNNHNEWWLEQDGKKVVVDGIAYRIRASSHHAIYPDEHEAITVYADPINKQSVMYQKIRKELGDDWSTDVLESPEFEEKVRRVIQAQAESSMKLNKAIDSLL